MTRQLQRLRWCQKVGEPTTFNRFAACQIMTTIFLHRLLADPGTLGMVPGMRKCRITRHSGCFLTVVVKCYANGPRLCGHLELCLARCCGVQLRARLGEAYCEVPIIGKAGTCCIVDRSTIHTRLDPREMDRSKQRSRRIIHHVFARAGELHNADSWVDFLGGLNLCVHQ